MVPEEARAKTDVEEQWRQFCTSNAVAEGQDLPDFLAPNVPEAFRAVMPLELLEVYEAMAATVQ